jgi:hypothetical protein
LCLVQPIFVRQFYLTDDRCTRHKEEARKRLIPFYEKPIQHVKTTVHDPQMRDGMVAMLDSLSKADQPIVSIQVVEMSTPPGSESTKSARTEQLRDQFVKEVTETLTQVWENGRVLTPADPSNPLPKMGEQLINFVNAPDGALPHFEIRYQFVPAQQGMYQLKATMTLRDDINNGRAWKSDITFPQPLSAPRAADKDPWAASTAKYLRSQILGSAVRGFNMPKMPQFPQFPLD